MKSFLSLFAILLSGFAFAQIPNNSFENWTNMGTYENPDGWGTMNNTTTLASIYTATKANPGNPGSFYMKLTSKTIGPAVINGVAVSGKLDSTTLLPKSGFAYTGQPSKFTGKYQHMIYGSSQGGMTVLLTKWNTSLNQRDTIAIANKTLVGMDMNWTNFSVNFTYFSSTVPDSCIIYLRASGANPTNNDYLWVDNLAFTGTLGLTEENNSIGNFSIYPNPSSDQISISYLVKEEQNLMMEITDVTGRIVFTKNIAEVIGENKEVITLDEFAKGTYIITISSEKGKRSTSFIKE